MHLVSSFIGYRMPMAQQFRQSQSLQVYKGLTAKIMIKLNLAFSQTFKVQGQSITLAVNKKSLAHFVWRHNRNTNAENYDSRMKSLYKVSHSVFHKKNREFTEETSFQLGQRTLFNESLSVDDFIKVVKEQAPLKGIFYKIKQNGKTAGYLLGTIHAGNPLLLNLNPKIRTALSKSMIVAGERGIDGVLDQIPVRQELKIKQAKFQKVLLKSLQRANLDISLGMEKCLLKLIQNSGQRKEFHVLETLEEARESVNLNYEVFNMNELPSGKIMYDIYREILSGAGAEKKVFLKSDPLYQNTIQRNKAMTERAIPLMERGRTFIAVGALHLHGEEGIKPLLEKLGYSLEKV